MVRRVSSRGSMGRRARTERAAIIASSGGGRRHRSRRGTRTRRA